MPDMEGDVPSKEACLAMLESMAREAREKSRGTGNPMLFLFVRYAVKLFNETYACGISEEDTSLNDPYTDVVCPECGIAAEYVDSREIYSSGSNGMRYRCPVCGAHVGVHKGTPVPLGDPANEEVRKLRQKVHCLFDQTMKTMKWSRTETYRWLAYEMGLEGRECQIGKFNKNQCVLALSIFRNKKSPKDKVVLYTGTCLEESGGECGTGAFGVILYHPASETKREIKKVLFGLEESDLEIEAAVEGLKMLKKPCRVRIVSDTKDFEKYIESETGQQELSRLLVMHQLTFPDDRSSEKRNNLSKALAKEALEDFRRGAL